MTAHGDEAKLFAAHHGELVNQLARRLGGDRDTAEEACALAWLQLLRVQPERSESIGGWLYVTAKHEAWRLYRLRSRDGGGTHDRLLERTGPAGRDPYEQLAERDQIRLLAHLSPAQRRVLCLVATGHSYKEICVATGHTYTWVNRHITEGRARLRQLAAKSRGAN